MSQLEQIKQYQQDLNLGCVQQMMRDMAIESTLRVAQSAMQVEVQELSGDKDSRKINNGPAKALRAGSDKVHVCILGQKIQITKPRLKIQEDGKFTEVPLQSYQALKKGVDQNEFLQAMAAGCSSNDFRKLRNFWDERGISGSAVCRQWDQAGSESFERLNSRDLSHYGIRCIMLDSLHIGDFSILCALGITRTGKKIPLGFTVDYSESSATVARLLEDLMDRGISRTKSILFVIDGSKGLRVGIEKTFGDRALFQRCTLHKLRNITSKLMPTTKDGKEPSEEEIEEAEKLIQKFKWQWQKLHRMQCFEKAKECYDSILEDLATHEGTEAAVRSMEESKLETLTLIKLSVPKELRRYLGTTNIIESVFSHIRKRSSRVTYWRAGENGEDQVIRWTSNLLMDIEPRLKNMRYGPLMKDFATALDLYRPGVQNKAWVFQEALPA